MTQEGTLEKIVLAVVGFILVFGFSLLLNLAMTPLVNWVIHLFNSGITLSFWQVYGVWLVLGLLTGGGRAISTKQ